MTTTKMKLFVLLAVTIGIVGGVGPDLTARARLLRDLPIDLQANDKVPPRVRDRTIIDLSLSIRSVDLDFEAGTFRTDGWMALNWNDPRYTWSPMDYEGIGSIELPFSKIWAPEVILHNSVEEKFIYRQVGILKHNGDIVYIMSVHTKSACEPNYDDFPFAMQHCNLQFGSWVNEQYQVEYRLPKNGTVTLDDFASPNGWQMVATGSHLESVQYPLFEEPAHSVVFEFAFKRRQYFDQKEKKLRKSPGDHNEI